MTLDKSINLSCLCFLTYERGAIIHLTILGWTRILSSIVNSPNSVIYTINFTSHSCKTCFRFIQISRASLNLSVGSEISGCLNLILPSYRQLPPCYHWEGEIRQTQALVLAGFHLLLDDNDDYCKVGMK